MERKIERPVVNQCKMFSIIKNKSFSLFSAMQWGGGG